MKLKKMISFAACLLLIASALAACGKPVENTSDVPLDTVNSDTGEPLAWENTNTQAADTEEPSEPPSKEEETDSEAFSKPIVNSTVPTLPPSTSPTPKPTEIPTFPPQEGFRLAEFLPDTPKSTIIIELTKKGEKFRQNELSIETESGTLFLFWSNGKSTYLERTLYQHEPNGTSVGDSIQKLKKVFGDSEPAVIFGEKYYCYYKDGYQWTFSEKDGRISGIAFSHRLMQNKVDEKQKYSNIFSGSFSYAEAENTDHQKKVAYTSAPKTKECFVQVAESQVGYINGAVKNGRVVFPHPCADGFNKFTGASGAWCAGFVSWCADRAGIPETVLERSAFADLNWKNFKPISSHTPERGDLVHFYYKCHGNKMQYANHIGIVASYDPTTDIIITVEGNARFGQCVRRAYKLNDPTTNIRGFSTF